MTSTRPIIPARLLAIILLSTLAACSSDDSRLGLTNPDGGTKGGGEGNGGMILNGCLEDQVTCDGNLAKVCDGKGGFKETIDCAEQDMGCAPTTTSQITGKLITRGCVACKPGEGSCHDGTAHYCPEDGSGFVRYDCDELQGMTCEADGCKGRCALPEAQHSYIGCDYYPTVTLNPVWRGFDFAVSVANAGEEPAHITISRGDDILETKTLEVGGIEVFPLPWDLVLKGDDVDACQIAPDPGVSRVVRESAYRVRSDQPVTVHQFSPLEYQRMEEDGSAPAGCPLGVECSPMFGSTDCLSYSNDASLLLPATALTGDYTILSWPSAANTASFYTVTATEDGTEVTLTGTSKVAQGGGVNSDGTGSVRLDRGDVLQVVAQHAGPGGGSDLDGDTSGTRIHATRPVQVIGGNSCAFIPDTDAGECDHLEQALFPSQIVGSEYVVSYPAAVASKSPHAVRIAALRKDTRVELDPPIVPGFVLSPDEPPRTLLIGSYQSGGSEPPEDVYITASEPIVVAQYMLGLEAVPSGSGDPSMALAVPVEQFRDSYVFTAPLTYDTSFINVIGPPDVLVQLDGIPIGVRGTGVGGSRFAVFRVELPDDGSASHTVEADMPVGLLVYGYGRFTSYMYPGGLDLKPITLVGPE